jgi:hypothetical protein
VASRQRERDAEAHRQLLQRDREILGLKERLRDVSRRLATKERPLRSTAKERGAMELQSIIVQAAKERMQLERHLAIATEVISSFSFVFIFLIRYFSNQYV